MPYQRKIFHRDEHCLNCEMPIIGNYCGHCGQKAHLHKDSVWHMLLHFFGDYFHYDNKFWKTLKTLFLKPGQITLDFVHGKRARYLNPIQLYIFVTTIFFLLFFSNYNNDEQAEKDKNSNPTVSNNVPVSNVPDVNINFGKPKDSEEINDTSGKTESQNLLNAGEKKKKNKKNIEERLKKYQGDGIGNAFMRRILIALDKAEKDEKFKDEVSDKFLHQLPKMLFILLPVFAFLIHIVHANRKVYYVDNLVFSMHYHVVIFIIMFVVSIIDPLLIWLGIDDFVYILAILGMICYFFLSLRKVYPSSIIKTLIKMIFVGLLYIFTMFLVLTTVFIFVFLLGA